jgi:predicted CXXCH cytochrome family protein
VAAALVGLSTAALAGISGTSHDLRTLTSETEICIVCHTPHNADTAVPLWDHDVTGETFSPYTSDTLNSSPGDPTGVSLLCLSCHDGVTAIDSYGGATGTNLITGTANFGTDLSDDHPISMAYSADDSGLYADTTLSGLGGSIAGDMLFGGNVECASCHDPHGTAFSNFLVKANTASALCLTCHNK